RVRRLVRQIFLAGEESQERAALLGHVIADGAFQHGVALFHRIEYGPLRHRAFDLDFYFVPDVCQRAQVRGKFYADAYSHSSSTPLRRKVAPGAPRTNTSGARHHCRVWTSTDSTAGRSRTIGVHESPASGDA